MNTMVYNSKTFKCWGYPEKDRDDLGVPFFQPLIDKTNITKVTDHEHHGVQLQQSVSVRIHKIEMGRLDVPFLQPSIGDINIGQ